MPKWKRILSSNIFLVLILIFGILYFGYITTKKIPITWNEKETQVEGIVIRIKNRESKKEIWIKDSSRLRVFYSDQKQVEIGDQVQVKGTFRIPEKNTIPNGFNYAYYLWYHRERVVLDASDIQKIGQTKNLFLKIKKQIKKIISKRKNHAYLSLFLLGEKEDMDDLEQESFQTNGISHLFSISGMHFSLLIGLISALLLRKKKNSLRSFFILNIFLLLYLSLIDFIPSACRAFLFWEFLTISKVLKLDWSKTKCFFWMIVLMLFFKPFYFFDIGFQFSAILNFFFCQKIERKTGSRIWNALYFSTFTLLVSMPITLYYFYKVNFLSILWNLLFIPFVTIFFFPVQIFSLFLPFLSTIAYHIGNIFGSVSLRLADINFLSFTFCRPPIVWILIYYTLLFLWIKIKHSKAIGFSLFFLIFLLYHWNLFFPKSYFLMIDVGQGDSLLIHSNNHSMLVDTGGNFIKKEGKIYEQKLKPLLDSLGIRKLEILCLTHGDYDHVGEAIPLLQNMKVEKVYFNSGNFSKEEEKIRKLLIQKKIAYSHLKEKEILTLGNFSFYSLNRSSSDENKSSSVLLGKIKKQFFLLTGDGTTETEEYILEKYKLPHLLFLKVGHHGSKTSSSVELLKKTTPTYALISVGKKNRYKHPNREVVERLERYSKEIYMTSKEGSVWINFRKNVTFSLFPP